MTSRKQYAEDSKLKIRVNYSENVWLKEDFIQDYYSKGSVIE
jgi:hypothetical protein